MSDKEKKVIDVEVEDTQEGQNYKGLLESARVEIEELKEHISQYEKAYESLGKKYNKLNSVLNTVLNTYINSEE